MRRMMTRQQAITALVRFGMDPVEADRRVSELVVINPSPAPSKPRRRRRGPIVTAIDSNDNWAADCGCEVVYGD